MIRKLKIVWVLGFFVCGALLLYVANPSGTASFDPRGRIFGVIPFHIPSSSMAPSINVGDLILASTYAYWSSSPQPGDVIVFKHPKQPSVNYVFRVVAVGGDEVRMQQHQLFINGERMNEPHVQHLYANRRSTGGKWSVPADSLFVMGDNRDNAADSRSWGFVPAENVIGRVTYTADQGVNFKEFESANVGD